MKVAILAGGVGSRLSEETEVKPKPMVEIGGRPILWHIMMGYYQFNHKDFVIALGYKGDYIKKYMVEYCSLNSNLTVSFKTGEVTIHDGAKPDWNVQLVDTGMGTLTGGRIKRLAPYLGNEPFMLTWGDGVANVDLDDLLKFHRSHGKLVTMTAVHPPARFGHLDLKKDQITEFSEKPQTREGWINGAFFVVEPGAFDYIEGDDTQWEREPLERLAADGQLMAYKHMNFWQCMDTLRDKKLLEELLGDWQRTLENLELIIMRVLVTGHKGYIGTVMVPMMLEEGFDVVGYDSDLYQDCTYGEGIVEVPEINKDIRDVEAKDLDGIDAIAHLAGLSNDPLGDLNPDLTFDINHLASVRLAELAKKAGIQRFVFSSSCSNYGAGGDNMIDESGEFNPVTPYGVSKVRVEKDLTKMADDKFSPTFLRNATAYGVSPRLRFDLVLNNLVAWALTTGLVYLKSDGTPWRPIVHIADISRAFIAALRAPLEVVHNDAFNIGRTDQNYRIRELADIVKDTVPNCKVEYAEGAGPDKRCYRVDCSKAEKTLPGFEPVWDAVKGARELYDSYTAVGLELDDFEGPRYKRIDHIKKLIAEKRLDNKLRRMDTIST